MKLQRLVPEGTASDTRDAEHEHRIVPPCEEGRVVFGVEALNHPAARWHHPSLFTCVSPQVRQLDNMERVRRV